MRVARRSSFRGQQVSVTVRATGETVRGVLKGWGASTLQLWLGERGDEGYREFATGTVTVEDVMSVAPGTELSADECEAAGIDPVQFQWEHGRPATRADLTPSQVVTIATLERHA